VRQERLDGLDASGPGNDLGHQSGELAGDVRHGGQLGYLPAPARRIHADAWLAQMIENELRIGRAPDQLHHLAQL
jgi:hypothetical protein